MPMKPGMLASMLIVVCAINGMQQSQKLTTFDRQEISEAEGYWASTPGRYDWYQGQYPFPKKNQSPWPGQTEFLQKLKAIEESGSEYNLTGVKIVTSPGHAFSRFEENVKVGNKEFFYIAEGLEAYPIRWTQAMREYYIPRFNVKPSREFYEFVMAFPLKK